MSAKLCIETVEDVPLDQILSAFSKAVPHATDGWVSIHKKVGNVVSYTVVTDSIHYVFSDGTVEIRSENTELRFLQRDRLGEIVATVGVRLCES